MSICLLQDSYKVKVYVFFKFFNALFYMHQYINIEFIFIEYTNIHIHEIVQFTQDNTFSIM